MTDDQYIKDGVFPKPVPLGPRAVGWLESEAIPPESIIADGSIQRCAAAGRNGQGDAAYCPTWTAFPRAGWWRALRYSAASPGSVRSSATTLATVPRA